MNDSLLGAKVGLANHRCAAHHAAQLHSAEQYMIKSHSMRAYLLQMQRSYLRESQLLATVSTTLSRPVTEECRVT